MFQFPALLGFKPPIATGGVTSYYSTIAGVYYKSHRFTSSNSTPFTVHYPGTRGTMDFIIVGAGGSGAATTYVLGAGSGAGGEVLVNLSFVMEAGTYNIVAGVGGAATSGNQNGFNGTNSYIQRPGGQYIIAYGGGRGWLGDSVPSGVSGPAGSQGLKSGMTTGLQSPVYGYPNSGRSYYHGTTQLAGVGGGAGSEVGGDAGAYYGGNGAAGVLNSFRTGTDEIYGGGAGGASGGSGGSGGGNGGDGGSVGSGGAGAKGYGGGGAGGFQSGGQGGNGIVIIRYQITP